MSTAAPLRMLTLVACGLLPVTLAASCDFDAAFERYCEGNAACLTAPGEDASGTESAPDAQAPDAGPDAGALPDAALMLAPPRNCASDADCAAGSELCHPSGNVCVPTCVADADCPPEQHDCEPLHGPGGVPLRPEKVCQCNSPLDCSGIPGATCNRLDNICEAMCASDDDCAGFQPRRSCDLRMNACVLERVTCSSDADCTSPTQPRCDFSGVCSRCMRAQDCAERTDGRNDCDPSGACVPFKTCNPANQFPGPAGGPDTCRYGQVCVVSACAPVQSGGCPGASGVPWDQPARPPVVVRAVATVVQPADATLCPNASAMISANIEFYAPNGFNYAASQVRFKDPATGHRTTASFVRREVGSGAQAGRFTAGLCGYASFAGWAVVMTDQWGRAGNAMCLTSR